MAKVAHDVCTKVTLFNSMNLCTHTVFAFIAAHDMCVCVRLPSVCWFMHVYDKSNDNFNFFFADFLCVVLPLNIQHSCTININEPFQYVFMCVRAFMIGSTRQCNVLVDRHFDFQLNQDD